MCVCDNILTCRVLIAVNRCTPLPDIALATPDNRNTTEGTNVTYTCQTGYEFYKGGNTNQVVCQADRTWSKNVELNCNST